MSSRDNTFIDKAKHQERLKEIDHLLKEISRSDDDLQKKLEENKTHKRILTDEKEQIELNLNANFANKKVHANTDSNSNEKNNSNAAKESIENTADNKILEEDDKNISNLSISIMNTTTNSCKRDDDKNTSNSSSQTNNNTADDTILEEEEEEEDKDKDEDEYRDEDEYGDVKVKAEKLKHSKICKNFNKLKFFFEKTWDIDCNDIEIEYTSDQKVTNKQKLAYIKMFIFRVRHFIDFYDGKIKKALRNSYAQGDTFDSFKVAMENLFDTLITRSKVLELYENCGKEVDKLYGQLKGVNVLQIGRKSTHFYYDVIFALFGYSNCDTWSFQQMKAVCEFWQAGVISEFKPVFKETIDFKKFSNEFLNSLRENHQLTEDQRETLLSILQAGEDYCNK